MSQLLENGVDVLSTSISSLIVISNEASFIQSVFPLNPLVIPDHLSNLERSYDIMINTIGNYSKYNKVWNYCADSYDLFENSIPMYRFSNNTYSVEYTNADNLFRQVINNAKQFILKFKDSQQYDSPVLFLKFAAFGKTSDHLTNILEKISQCENSGARKMFNFKLLMIFVGVAVIVVFGSLLIVISAFLSRQQLLIWSFITASINDSQSFKDACCDRLVDFHRKANLLATENDFTQKILKEKHPLLKSGKKFFIRIFIFIIMYSIFYVISNYAYYNDLQQLLQDRTEVLLNLAISRKLVVSIDFWNRSLFFNGLLSPSLYSKDFLPFTTDYSSRLFGIIDELRQRIQSMKADKYNKLFGETTIESMFFSENFTDCAPLWSGTYAATYSVIFDTYYIGFSGVRNVAQEVDLYTKTMEILGKKNELAFATVKENSYQYIQNQFISYIRFGLLYVFLVVFCFVLEFIIMLSSEVRKLSNIKQVMKCLG